MIHHEYAIERFVALRSGDPQNLAVIITGSVARGTERADSDVDLYLVVADDAWDNARAEERVMYTDTTEIGYDGGYFDVKLASVPYLDAAAERADDPTRASFDKCRIAWSRMDDLAERIGRIAHPPDSNWSTHEASFIAQARLHGGYFLPGAVRGADPFLTTSAGLHLANAACRAVLARYRVLFQGPKYLRATVTTLVGLPDGFVESIDSLVESPDEAGGARVLDMLESMGDWPVSQEQTLSRFVQDNELAWFDGSLPPEYR